MNTRVCAVSTIAEYNSTVAESMRIAADASQKLQSADEREREIISSSATTIYIQINLLNFAGAGEDPDLLVIVSKLHFPLMQDVMRFGKAAKRAWTHALLERVNLASINANVTDCLMCFEGYFLDSYDKHDR